jgi:hypothetical protein
VCGSDTTRRDSRQVAVFPGRANCTLRTSVRSLLGCPSMTCLKHRRSVGRAKRGRLMTMSVWFADDAERDHPRCSSASLRSAQARSARRLPS